MIQDLPQVNDLTPSSEELQDHYRINELVALIIQVLQEDSKPTPSSRPSLRSQSACSSSADALEGLSRLWDASGALELAYRIMQDLFQLSRCSRIAQDLPPAHRTLQNCSRTYSSWVDALDCSRTSSSSQDALECARTFSSSQDAPECSRTSSSSQDALELLKTFIQLISYFRGFLGHQLGCRIVQDFFKLTRYSRSSLGTVACSRYSRISHSTDEIVQVFNQIVAPSKTSQGAHQILQWLVHDSQTLQLVCRIVHELSDISTSLPHRPGLQGVLQILQ